MYYNTVAFLVAQQQSFNYSTIQKCPFIFLPENTKYMYFRVIRQESEWTNKNSTVNVRDFSINLFLVSNPLISFISLEDNFLSIEPKSVNDKKKINSRNIVISGKSVSITAS